MKAAPASPNRPRRSATETRERILQVALAQFATKGLDGSRVDVIAERARVSKNMLYHYFGSKDGLFLAVMERTYDSIRKRQDESSFAQLAATQAMERLVGATFDLFVEMPEVINLLNTENLHLARHVSRSSRIRSMYAPLTDEIAVILRKGEREGTFRKVVDPVELYISISGLGYFYLSNRWTLAAIFDIALDNEERIARRRSHVIDVIMSFLCGTPYRSAGRGVRASHRRSQRPPRIRHDEQPAGS